MQLEPLSNKQIPQPLSSSEQCRLFSDFVIVASTFNCSEASLGSISGLGDSHFRCQEAKPFVCSDNKMGAAQEWKATGMKHVFQDGMSPQTRSRRQSPSPHGRPCLSVGHPLPRPMFPRRGRRFSAGRTCRGPAVVCSTGSRARLIQQRFRVRSQFREIIGLLVSFQRGEGLYTWRDWESARLKPSLSGAEDVTWAPWHWADANLLAPHGPRQPQDVLPGPVSPARTLESRTLMTAY